MKTYLGVLTLVFAASLAGAWQWGVNHRLSYLSRDYALFAGKEKLIEDYSRAGLAVFGDSIVMDDVLPGKLGPRVINCGMNGSTPIEAYFLVRRLLKAPVHPAAVLLSYNAYHFVHPDFYWENTVKFGILSGPEADEVMGRILEFHDKELLSGSSPWHLEQRLYSFLLSRGFPPYYMSSLWAEPFGARAKENEEALRVIARTRGQYYFPQANGSKDLNADTKLKAFTVDPVVGYYFRETLDILEKGNVPAYFYVMPVNESSVPYLDSGVFKAYRDYLEGFTRGDGQFHIIPPWRTVYSWKLFSDYAHLNLKGALRFNREFAALLNRNRVPGEPYGVSTPSNFPVR